MYIYICVYIYIYVYIGFLSMWSIAFTSVQAWTSYKQKSGRGGLGEGRIATPPPQSRGTSNVG